MKWTVVMVEVEWVYFYLPQLDKLRRVALGESEKSRVANK